MKFIHLSDLHLGKRVNEFSMLEDQKFILKRIINVIDEEKPDAVLIAGDVYDKSVPSSEAVSLLDDFLFDLSKRDTVTFVISGNHDSPRHLAFGSRLMTASGIRISPVYSGSVEPIVLTDGLGEVNVYMLPFVKPAHVRTVFPDENVESYTDAMRVAIEKMSVDTSARNVLVAHQFVTGAVRSESEDVSVGGLDNVDASVFEPFDYVALGHIHGPQNIGSDKIRYCGTPLKYSFSEVDHEKSVTVAELGAKGDLKIRTVPLEPKRDMVSLRGSYDELTLRSFYEGTAYGDDYVRIVLTDEDDIPDAASKLRLIYHNLMKLEYDNTRTRSASVIGGAEDVERKTPLELFSELHELQNGAPMTEEQRNFAEKLIEAVWEDEQ